MVSVTWSKSTNTKTTCGCTSTDSVTYVESSWDQTRTDCNDGYLEFSCVNIDVPPMPVERPKPKFSVLQKLNKVRYIRNRSFIHNPPGGWGFFKW